LNGIVISLDSSQTQLVVGSSTSILVGKTTNGVGGYIASGIGISGTVFTGGGRAVREVGVEFMIWGVVGVVGFGFL
jgi:hypothetical protein